MNRPKKWFIGHDEDSSGLIVKTSEGPLQKANASKPLGRIVGVAIPTEEQCVKYTVDESVVVSLHVADITTVHTRHLIHV